MAQLIHGRRTCVFRPKKRKACIKRLKDLIVTLMLVPNSNRLRKRVEMNRDLKSLEVNLEMCKYGQIYLEKQEVEFKAKIRVIEIQLKNKCQLIRKLKKCLRA